jgi:hypothetical protein
MIPSQRGGRRDWISAECGVRNAEAKWNSGRPRVRGVVKAERCAIPFLLRIRGMAAKVDVTHSTDGQR